MYGQTLKTKQKKMTGIVIIVVYALVRLLSDVVSDNKKRPTK